MYAGVGRVLFFQPLMRRGVVQCRCSHITSALRVSYCIFPAVRGRAAEKRAIRTPPPRVRPTDKKPNVGKPQRGLKKSQRRVPKVV